MFTIGPYKLKVHAYDIYQHFDINIYVALAQAGRGH